MIYVLIAFGVVAVLGAVYSYVSASKVDEIPRDWDKEDIDSIYLYSWPKDFVGNRYCCISSRGYQCSF